MLSGKIVLFLGGLGLLALLGGGGATAGDLTHPVAQQAGTTYIVQPGDTLVGIAYRAYGDAAAWPCIQAANPSIRNGNDLLLGARLTLPSKTACAARARQTPPPPTAPPTPAARPTNAPVQRAGSPTPPPVGAWSVYVIRSGDTLAGIAWRTYGNPGVWPCIWAANQWIANPRFLLSGWQITLPPRAACAVPVPAPAPGPRYHTVAGTETLSGIACRYYADCNYWRIYNANRSKIWNVNYILPGTVLLIP